MNYRYNYKQIIRRLLPRASLSTRVKTTTDTIHMIIQAFYHGAHCVMHRQWFNMLLYHWGSLLPVDKRTIMSCHVKITAIHLNSLQDYNFVHYCVYTYNLVTIYVAGFGKTCHSCTKINNENYIIQLFKV